MKRFILGLTLIAASSSSASEINKLNCEYKGTYLDKQVQAEISLAKVNAQYEGTMTALIAANGTDIKNGSSWLSKIESGVLDKDVINAVLVPADIDIREKISITSTKPNFTEAKVTVEGRDLIFTCKAE